MANPDWTRPRNHYTCEQLWVHFCKSLMQTKVPVGSLGLIMDVAWWHNQRYHHFLPLDALGSWSTCFFKSTCWYDFISMSTSTARHNFEFQKLAETLAENFLKVDWVNTHTEYSKVLHLLWSGVLDTMIFHYIQDFYLNQNSNHSYCSFSHDH